MRGRASRGTKSLKRVMEKLEELRKQISNFECKPGCRVYLRGSPEVRSRDYKPATATREYKKHGWPPAHCDADGDFREEEEN